MLVSDSSGRSVSLVSSTTVSPSPTHITLHRLPHRHWLIDRSPIRDHPIGGAGSRVRIDTQRCRRILQHLPGASHKGGLAAHLEWEDPIWEESRVLHRGQLAGDHREWSCVHIYILVAALNRLVRGHYAL